MRTATVVGAGPNGLAAAVTLARHGVDVTVLEAADRIGGGTDSRELTVPGLLHDHCAAVHPMAAASPFLNSLDLGSYGLTWLRPPVDLAHPLDGGRAGALLGAAADTAAGLGVDGPRWRRLFEPLAAHADEIMAEVTQPLAHLPRHPVSLARLGIRAVWPAALVARGWRTEEARALYGGIAAHAFQPLTRPATAAMATAFVAVNDRYGWPVAQGGSRAITDALAALLRALGGRIETGARIGRAADLPAADITLFNLMPAAVADILGDRLPARVRRAYRRYRFGPGVFKLDLAVEGGIPWTNPVCARAGTVHLGGGWAEIVAAERLINQGKLPDRPFVLVAQQYLADPGRSAGNLHPVYAYAHVPHGYPGDVTGPLLDQIERFAPGFRERIVATTATGPADFAAGNPNLVGGDVLGGAAGPTQLLTRPRVALDPYYTGVAGMYICSAATPPGAGATGMAGHNAARAALRRL